ncbi:phage tail tape measure protein [Streptomyces sp. NPDC050145]|uniref:phage tail tape measure protein n=1 Tax=Streptomyces sp. NPDC050145 TaxID=3365602 RepID=UPI0037981406
MAAPEVAVAYVSIVPEIEGFARQLRQQIVAPSADAGEEAGRSMSGKLKAGMAAAGLAAGALLAKGVMDAIDQANVTARLGAQLGSTGKDADRYGKVAGKLYSQGVSGSFQEAADAIKAVVQNGLAPPGATNKQLQSIATKAADVANVFDQDLGGVTRAVSQMLRTGMAKNATEAFDIITKGMQNGANKADDLLDTFNEYSTQFRKLGLDGKSALGLISQMVKAGARDSDLGADALKEFSIRAVDMSKTSQDAYKALGLDAEKMSAQIAKGGDSASSGLTQVIERLKAMKDPVAREAAAVGLFGTQAEDLGKALFAMDPSKAVSSLGQVGGAAGKMGKQLRSGPSHEIEVFVRTLQQGFVDVLGRYVIPGIRGFMGAVATVGGVIGDVVGWFDRWSPILAPVAIGIAGITLALQAQAIATGLTIAVMNAYAIGVRAISLVTRVWAGAQALLNAVMALNPIALVVIALVALGAGLVLAYQKSETFRQIVQAAWAGIQAAALYAWNVVLKPVFQALAAIVQWIYGNVIKPVFGLIVGVFKFWWSAVKFYFGVVAALFRSLAKVAQWLYGTIIKPIFGLIVGVFKLWWGGVKTYFGYVKAAFRAIADVAKWLWSNAIRPVFNWISDKAKWLWSHGVKPSFDAVKRGVRAVADAFKTAKDAIRTAWSKLESIARKPVAFIVNTVYGKGIRPVWNKVAGAFGAPTLPAMKFAAGGILPGYTPGRDPHKFYSPTGGRLELSGGEAIMRPEVTRALGVGTVNALNAAARSGGVHAVRSALGGGQAFAKGGVVQRFASGGVFGWVGKAASGAWDKVKKGASWLKDGIKASALAGLDKIVKPLINKISGDAGLYSDLVKAVPTRMVKAILGFSEKADKKSEALGIGGKGTKSALRWARTQNGKRYQWGGNGNPSWDCSGFMSAIESVIRGQRPHRRWATGSFAGATAAPGWVRSMKAPFMIGITNAGVGHTAGTINGVNVESRGGDGVIVGPRARSYKSSLFTDWYGFAPSKKYDSGGWLQPGATMAVNKTGRPEPILTSSQWANVSTLASAAGSGLQAGDRLVLVTDGGSFEAYVDKRADERIESGLVGPAARGRRL